MTENKGASMSEPVAWLVHFKRKKGVGIGIEDVLPVLSKESAVHHVMPELITKFTPLYTHPAPAPAGISYEKITPSQAVAALSDAMHKDPDYAWSWHCNVAMAAHDAGAPHDKANEQAAQFMRNAFGVDTSIGPTGNPAPAPASLRDMTEADFDQAHGIAPAGVPDVASVALEEFTEWLCREMPSGTIIGEPKWWAPRIFRAAHPAQAPASLRDMTEADFDQAHGIAPAGVPDVISQLIKCCKAWEPSVCILGNVRAGEAATALAALQSELSRETFRKIDQIRINQDIRRENAQQAERIITLEAKLAEAVGLLDAVEPNSCIDVNGVNWYDARQAFFIKAREVMG